MKLMKTQARSGTASAGKTLTNADRDSVSAYLKDAERFIKEKDYERALDALALAHELDPRNMYIQAYRERIFELQAEQGSSRPTAVIEKVRSDTDIDVEAYIKQADTLIGEGKLDEALDVITQAYMIDPTNLTIDSYAQRITELKDQQKIGTEPPIFNEELERYLDMAQDAILQGDAAGATDALMQAFVIDPSHPRVIECEERLRVLQDTINRAEQEAEEKRRKAEEEAQRKAEEEARRKAEEEARRKAEEEARHKAEEEARRKAEEEARRKAEEEARRKAEEEARRKAEEEAKRKAEEERKRKEEEAKRKAEEEAKRKAEEEAKRKAEEEARRKVEEERKRKEEKKSVSEKKKKPDAK
ncbi:MAG: hypothetical protein ABSB78_07900 [Bacteroidota bacterium]